MLVSQVVLVLKNPPVNAGDIRDAGLTPESGRSPGGGHGNLLWCSCLESPTDRGAWPAMIRRVAKSQMLPKQPTTHSTALTDLTTT